MYIKFYLFFFMLYLLYPRSAKKGFQFSRERTDSLNNVWTMAIHLKVRMNILPHKYIKQSNWRIKDFIVKPNICIGERNINNKKSVEQKNKFQCQYLPVKAHLPKELPKGRRRAHLLGHGQLLLQVFNLLLHCPDLPQGILISHFLVLFFLLIL